MPNANNQPRATLISNGSSTGSPVPWNGGPGIFQVAGTFGGSTVSIQYMSVDGSTYITLGSLTAAGILSFVAPQGLIRASVSGGSPSGLYAAADSVSAASSDGAFTTGTAEVSLASLLSGELQQFNRLAGGAICPYVPVSADTVVSSGPAVYYGAFCVAAGTMAAIYDNTSASGTKLLDSQVGVANTFYGFGGLGVQCANGIYADWTSGTWLVLCLGAV